MNPVSGKSFDGIGIIPDIPIESKNAYQRSLLEAYHKLADMHDDPSLKQIYAWQIPYFENELNPAVLDDKFVSGILGKYEGGRELVFEDSIVYYVNTKGEREPLKYMGNGIFQHGTKPYLRLVVPISEQANEYIEWVWDDGGEPQRIKKEKK